MFARKSLAVGLVCLFTILVRSQQPQQKISGYERGMAQTMLEDIDNDVRKHYYDPKFHGLDWNARVKEAKQRIDKAETLNQALSEVAAALDTLNDSHTFFAPPTRPYLHEYGWRQQMIGDRCYVVQVMPNSDANAKDVRPGDEVLSMNGNTPNRNDLWRLEYYFNRLHPQPGLRLILRGPEGSQHQVDVMAKVTQLKRVMDLNGEDIWAVLREEENEERLIRIHYAEMGDPLMVLKFPEFAFSDADVDGMLGKAAKHKALILDLRGNPGGSAEMLEHFIGDLFENDVKIGDRVRRDKKEPVVARHGRSHFDGKLIVLVDSNSASASEILARLVQIEHRGVVLGDQTSGSVMEARHYSYKVGMDTVVFFGASITDADLIMTDGKSLEHTGVTPDQVILPTAADLANDRDPVLAHAAEMLGVQLSPEQAGKMFPYEWPQQ